MRESETYAAHAVRCRAEADEATLDNVRDRALRAEAAWTAMASRSAKSETQRDTRTPRPLEDAAPDLFGGPPPIR